MIWKIVEKKITIIIIIYSQEEYSPEDPANPCVNYPTEEYESYAECDDHFVRRSLPPGLKPFWTVDNISEATNNFSIDTNEGRKLLSHVTLGRKQLNWQYCS